MISVTDFCSEGYYIYLPSHKNPKVILAVDSSEIAINTFKLYNPFSRKSKLLKAVVQTLFSYVNPLAKRMIGHQESDQSALLAYLEKKLDTSLISSVYIATIKDKVVLQLQTQDAQLIGYLKYPINEIGVQHLENEKKAIAIFSAKKIVPNYLLSDSFEGNPFLLLSPLDGEIGMVSREVIDTLLHELKRGERYPLRDHPRVRFLQKVLIEHDLLQYCPKVQAIIQKSTAHYALVYEHGDFTPWNIIKVNDKYIPFDFEHFVEDGLEYFDLIKYYYQVGKLLEGKRGDKLINHVQREVEIPEFLDFLTLYLIKEIVRCYEENEPFDIEVELLECLEKE